MRRYLFSIFLFASAFSTEPKGELETLPKTEVVTPPEPSKKPLPPIKKTPLKKIELPPLQEVSEDAPEIVKPPEVLTKKYEALFIKMFAIVFLIALSAGFIVWLYRRFNFTKMHQLNYLRSIKIVEKRPLSPKTMLYLVEVNGEQLMLAESQLEVRQVMSFPSDKEAVSRTLKEV